MSYSKKTWKDGDIIHASNLNNMEEGIAEANKTAASASNEAAIATKALTYITTLPFGGSKEWLEANGDTTQLYQIDGYVWGYVETDGWTKGGTQYLVVSSESEMINEGGTEYLLRSGDEGTVYAYAEASGDAGVPVYDSLPETANNGDIVAVSGRKYKATVSEKQVPTYTNHADPTSADWVVGRIRSSGEIDTASTDLIATNFIGPIYSGDIIRIQGMNLSTNASPVYTPAKALTNYGAAKLADYSSYSVVATDITATTTGGQVTVGTLSAIQGGYWRFNGAPNGTENDIIITVNEEITTKTETTISWTDIGEYIAPVEAGWNATEETYDVIDSLQVSANGGDYAVYSADGYVYLYIIGADWLQMSKYTAPNLVIDGELSDSSENAVQNKIVKAALDEVKEQAKTNENDIITLQNEVEALGGGTSSEVVTIPSYWESMVASKTETIKALQTVGGKNCVSFAWAGDTHIPDNHNTRTNDIGKVMAKMLDNCEIPFAMISGDIATRASYPTEAEYLEKLEEVSVHLAPLWGTDRLLMCLGNHDGTWGDSSKYYGHHFTPERMWHTFFRGQALDLRRVFSDDGSYFYVDNFPQKTRFIVLNSQFAGVHTEDENGWLINSHWSFGQAQLDWLTDVALDMPDGYSAIITMHAPPWSKTDNTMDKDQLVGILNAYCDKTTFSGSYTGSNDSTQNSNISVDFTGAKGDIIAVFSGHVHGDDVDTTTLKRPVITILAAGAPANEHLGYTAPARTAGTDTETSFDVVTINKATRKIYCTRVGAGSDREFSY